MAAALCNTVVLGDAVPKVWITERGREILCKTIRESAVSAEAQLPSAAHL